MLYYSGSGRNNNNSSSNGGGGGLSGSYTGLLGSMSAVMGQDSALSSELQIVFKKLYKPSSVTKLKALDELGHILEESVSALSTGGGSESAAAALAVCDLRDEGTVGALLETFGQLYPRLSTDPERGIRERSSNVLGVLLLGGTCGAARKCLGRHIKAVLPAWLCAMNDPAREVAGRARAAFSVLPPAGQARAVAAAQGEVAAFLKEGLTRSLAGLVPLGHPQTRDDKTAVQDQIDRTFSMYLGAIGTAARVLLTAPTPPQQQQQQQENKQQSATTIAIAASIVQTVFPAPSTWAVYFGNKNSAARKAVYRLISDLAEAAATATTGGDCAERLVTLVNGEAKEEEKEGTSADVAALSKLVMRALGEKDAGAQGAMWGCVLGWLRCVGDAAWAAVAPELRKSVLPRLWALLRSGCNGAPEASYPCLLVFLSLVPHTIRTDGEQSKEEQDKTTTATFTGHSFYRSFFGAFWEGLVRCALDSAAPGAVGTIITTTATTAALPPSLLSSSTAAGAKGLCECLRYALLHDAAPGSPLEAWLLAGVLEPLLLTALCDTRFRPDHARALASEAAEAAARVLEARRGTPAAAGLWAVLADALRYALGASPTYPRPVTEVMAALDAQLPSPPSQQQQQQQQLSSAVVVVKRRVEAAEVILEHVAAAPALQGTPERDALLRTAFESAITSARSGSGNGNTAEALAFAEKIVLPLLLHVDEEKDDGTDALFGLETTLVSWLQELLLLLHTATAATDSTTVDTVVRLCVAALHTPEDWEALLTVIQSAAQTPEPFAECLAAAATTAKKSNKAKAIYGHPELVGAILLQYTESAVEKAGPHKAVVRALTCAASATEPMVNAVTMEAIAAILLDALEKKKKKKEEEEEEEEKKVVVEELAPASTGFLLDAAGAVVHYFLRAQDTLAEAVHPLLAQVFVASTTLSSAEDRDKAFAVWDAAAPSLQPSGVAAVVRLFVDTVTAAAAAQQRAGSVEVTHKAIGRHVRSLLALDAGRPALLKAVEAEVAACEAPLCEMYAPHLLYYGRCVSAPIVAAAAAQRTTTTPPQLSEKALQTYRIAFAVARELSEVVKEDETAQLWLLTAAALIYPVAETGCYEEFADLRTEARRVLAVFLQKQQQQASSALFDALVAKARGAARESAASAMYALAAELVGRGTFTEGAPSAEAAAAAAAFGSFFLSSDHVALQYAGGALAGFEALVAALTAQGPQTAAEAAGRPSPASTAKRLADELIASDFTALDQAVLCRTLSAVAAFVRLGGAYSAQDITRLTAAVAERLLPALAKSAATALPQLAAAMRLLNTLLTATAVDSSSNKAPWASSVRNAFCATAATVATSGKRLPHAQCMQTLAYAADLTAATAAAGCEAEGSCDNSAVAAEVARVVAAFPRSGIRAETVHAQYAARSLSSLYSALVKAKTDTETPFAATVAEHARALLERVAVAPSPRVQALAYQILCDGLGSAAAALGPLEDLTTDDLAAAAAVSETDREDNEANNNSSNTGAHMPKWVTGALAPVLARSLVYPQHALGGNGEVLPDNDDAQYYDVPLGPNASTVRSARALDYGCMLAWGVAVRVAVSLHPSRRPLFALALRATGRVGTALLLLLHYCLPEDRSSERPALPEKCAIGGLAHMSTAAAGAGQAESVERAPLRRLAAELLLEMLKCFPTLVRLWYVVNSDHRAARAAETYVRLVNPTLCECQLGKASGRAVVEYENDDIVVRAAVVLPDLYPLVPPTIESVGRAEGLDDTLWRKWQMGLNSLLAAEEEEGCPGGLAKRAAERWKDSLDKHFDGIEPCPICYSVFASNGHLPTLKCRVCKHKFHSSCMYKWFSTSHKTTCPLCKSDFAIKGFN